MQRIPVTTSPRHIVLLDADEIYYIEGERGDTLVRTSRRTRLRSVHRLSHWTRKLQPAGFLRIHRSYLVNMARVRELRLRKGRSHDWELKLDPPVNTVLPVGRGYLTRLRESLDL